MRIRPWENHVKSLEKKEASAKAWETLLTRAMEERKGALLRLSQGLPVEGPDIDEEGDLICKLGFKLSKPSLDFYSQPAIPYSVL